MKDTNPLYIYDKPLQHQSWADTYYPLSYWYNKDRTVPRYGFGKAFIVDMRKGTARSIWNKSPEQGRRRLNQAMRGERQEKSKKQKRGSQREGAERPHG